MREPTIATPARSAMELASGPRLPATPTLSPTWAPSTQTS
ncbi:hypothetical protein F442_10434 [Phytophthora nicotianae P10297]|uniref:Uncharacterized protein n=1 Tax=Phytophthora nicotianae P10297 TaxID=1317064 RepID=W2Z6Y3_PHYNI|nr:hypothetical protein F442_10434 [Phytophthora nicotianae P10297]